MTEELFPTDIESIKHRIDCIDPLAYGKTRNYTDGAVTRLSPYLSRGVISLRLVYKHIREHHSYRDSETLIRELAWREYWQRVWESRGDDILSDLRREQQDVQQHQIPIAVLNAQTGIHILDEAIKQLYETGYLHNHLRMYLASVICNRGKYHWRIPSAWMYYHLIDADIASNTLSWQWVAGSFSSKKYWCNQDNINEYTKSKQQDSFLNYPYDQLPLLTVPDSLSNSTLPALTTQLPPSEQLPENAGHLFIHNTYNLDPDWHRGEPGCRILLLEPLHFQQFPVSQRVLNWILKLASTIDEIHIFCGSFMELQARFPAAISHYKKHPSCRHYRGIAEEPDYLFPEVTGYFPSFSAYWNQVQKRRLLS